MAQALQESLSACMDSEAQNNELRRVLDESNSSDELRSNWRCYSAISAVLRGEKLSSLENPPRWEEEAARIPDDYNIVALQGRRRVNRRTAVGSISVLALAATLVIGVFVLTPDRPDSANQPLAVSDDQVNSVSPSGGDVVGGLQTPRTSNVINIPSDIQQKQLQYLFEYDLYNSAPFPHPQVTSRKASLTAE